MSLAEAVLSVAEEMEKEAKHFEGDTSVSLTARIAIEAYAKQLRIAVKASQGNFPPQTTVLPEQVMEDRAKQIRLRDQQVEAYQEENSRQLTLLQGGDSDGVAISAPPNLPVGAKTLQAGQVYVKGEDQLFHFSPEETENYHEKMMKENTNR